MINRSNIFKVLGGVIIFLVASLVVINVFYVKSGCPGKNCMVVGVATIALLLWATAFWVMVLKYSKKEK